MAVLVSRGPSGRDKPRVLDGPPRLVLLAGDARKKGRRKEEEGKKQGKKKRKEEKQRNPPRSLSLSLFFLFSFFSVTPAPAIPRLRPSYASIWNAAPLCPTASRRWASARHLAAREEADRDDDAETGAAGGRRAAPSTAAAAAHCRAARRSTDPWCVELPEAGKPRSALGKANGDAAGLCFAPSSSSLSLSLSLCVCVCVCLFNLAAFSPTHTHTLPLSLS